MSSPIKKLLDLIADNEPIIVPTDTVYGLVCQYDSRIAVEKIYRLKKRTRKKPLILLGYNWKSLKQFVRLQDISHSALRTLQSYWPGPLTIVLPASKSVPKFLNKGFKTIGVRVPNNKLLLKLLKHSPGQVLASTSANVSGKSDRIPQKELLEKVKLFVKATKGEMLFKPSKVVEIKKNKIMVLRSR